MAMTEHSSTPSISPPPSNASPNSSTNAKPIKLRSACNHCFSAKVRCDGNKQGCRRCCEKHLNCTYSESRVGKVVGKRRKRPLDDSIGMINSAAWTLNDHVPVQSLPSPATTHFSDESAKRKSVTGSWASFIASDDQGLINFDDSVESLHSIDMTDNRSYSTCSDLAFLGHNGLPTPALSPPQFKYLSPATLEATPMSRQVSVTVDNSRLLPPRGPPSIFRSPSPSYPEDEETVCIKLLAHLKKHSVQGGQSRDAQTNLLTKSSAAVRRILRSKSIRSDYNCQLLLSSINTHLVALCEDACAKRPEDLKGDSQFLRDQIHFDAAAEYFQAGFTAPLQPGSNDTIRNVVQEATALTSEIGDLLKRKPLYGFQTLGRQESLHVELEQRLRRALMGLE